MVARTYSCKKCNEKYKPETITEPLTYTPKCWRCGEYMTEAYDE